MVEGVARVGGRRWWWWCTSPELGRSWWPGVVVVEGVAGVGGRRSSPEVDGGRRWRRREEKGREGRREEKRREGRREEKGEGGERIYKGEEEVGG